MVEAICIIYKIKLVHIIVMHFLNIESRALQICLCFVTVTDSQVPLKVYQAEQHYELLESLFWVGFWFLSLVVICHMFVKTR